MNVDQVLGQVRPFIQLVGSALILVAAAKAFGFNPGLAGEGWQWALIGIGLRQF